MISAKEANKRVKDLIEFERNNALKVTVPLVLAEIERNIESAIKRKQNYLDFEFGSWCEGEYTYDVIFKQMQAFGYIVSNHCGARLNTYTMIIKWNEEIL